MSFCFFLLFSKIETMILHYGLFAAAKFLLYHIFHCSTSLRPVHKTNAPLTLCTLPIYCKTALVTGTFVFNFSTRLIF